MRRHMTNCHEMRKEQVYFCAACGLELQVVKECKEVGTPPEDCKCARMALGFPQLFGR